MAHPFRPGVLARDIRGQATRSFGTESALPPKPCSLVIGSVAKVSPVARHHRRPCSRSGKAGNAPDQHGSVH
jgi:hypothetical protein